MTNEKMLDKINQNLFNSEIAKMPPLSHWPDRSVEYDAANSLVLKWIMQQPHFKEWAFRRAKSTGLIVFDPETKIWHGAATEKGAALASSKFSAGE